MKIFVSYARDDSIGAERVVERLTQIDHQPWLDDRLTGGQSWWNEILRVIRESDIVVVILSPQSLASEACRLERQYAQRLGKPLLPIKIAPISTSALPRDLGSLQHIDFTGGDPNDEAAALIRALNRQPPTPPLPNPLPPLPPTPLSYLSDLHERISGQRQLSYVEQIDIANQLEGALRSPDSDELQGGLALLSKLTQRRDLYAETARHIQRMNGSMVTPPAPGPNPPWAAHGQYPAPPAGSTPSPAGLPARGTPKTVKVLAWIGAIMLVLILISAIAQSGTSSF